MSLKYKYTLYIGILHVALLVLIYYLFEENLWYFFGLEVLVLISLFLSYLLYNAFIRPLNVLKSGVDAISDKDFSVKYIETGSSDIDHLVKIYNYMIDSLRKERTMVSEQSYFIQKLIEVTPIGIIIMDYDGLISNINHEAKKQLDINQSYDAQGKKLSDFPSELAIELEKKEIGKADVIRINGIDKYKIQINQVIHQGFNRKFILIDDLSNELLKTEKEAYGTIIRMMAHEVNNSMGAVNSILDSVLEFGLKESEDQELRETLIIAQRRNSGLAKFMDNYASLLRLPKPNKKNIDLCLILQKAGQLFIPIAQDKNITIDFDFPNKEVFINADKILLEQAISNMIKNAIESIEQNGNIKISCKETPLSFCISDNGPGIEDDVAAHLFSPFFSTKTTGQGVGLMLIKDILQSHKAIFSLTSNKKSGWTNFEVSFE